MIGNGEQTVDIRRQIDPGDFGAFVYNYIEKPGILMSEAIVILTPDSRSDQQVQRGDFSRHGSSLQIDNHFAC